ncbi:hypothetical protein HKK52_06545 [Pseudomonas sp. ADAK2]|uniref:hypothetical protein n=1 Tax=unclassified Pseudomonas TaxID=196821 RepID=UPI001462E840|nr:MULTISPECIES: hypothetical protein [unclassified Pseudomonas]QJI40588.1 hypothetical protein HKK53_06540 [Pseudomonas sp. ADAK7]QJI46893.1 hypothetical protein HKK52_06545 [Pseudomonas sp. ADAK2]
MLLNEFEKELHRDLQSVESDLRWSAVELLRLAEQFRKAGNEVDAQAALRLHKVLEGDEELLKTYAEEVKARHINRTKAH